MRIAPYWPADFGFVSISVVDPAKAGFVDNRLARRPYSGLR
jgi:hypothetical protein